MTFEELKSEYKLRLNEQQEIAARTVDGPVLLLAVPGSGKTTTLVSRLGNMVYVHGIDPKNILTMTYTVAAARDMKQRFISIFGDEVAENLEFRTINGVCAKIIRTYERKYGRTAFEIIPSDKQSALISSIYLHHTHNFATEGIIQAILLRIAYAKNSMMTKEERERIKLDSEVKFEPIYQSYNDALVENHLMDFDDQLRYAYTMLRKYPALLAAFQKKYQYICVDEAQDTSKIQHMIIRLLAGKSQNLFMVGDEDQSIYGFRAAYPEALMEFDQVYPNAKVLLLEQNYRSTPEITSVADVFIRQNTARHEKTIQATRRNGLPIGFIYAKSRLDQYEQITAMAQTCRSQTAILYRNNDSVIPLIDMLDREGIPYRSRGLDSLFFSNKVVLDMLDFLAYAVNPFDYEAFERMYYKLGAGISKEKMRQAIEMSKETNLPPLKYLSQDYTASKYVRRQCADRSLILNVMGKKRADKAINNAMAGWYEDYCKERKTSIDKIETLRILARFQDTPAKLIERIAELKEIIQRGTMDVDSPVILSTIHSSKGLEYDRVILIDVIDGIFPQIVPSPSQKLSKEELDELEEDRRLFYVGMTRAKDELLIVRFSPPGQTSDTSSCFTNTVMSLQKVLKKNRGKG